MTVRTHTHRVDVRQRRLATGHLDGRDAERPTQGSRTLSTRGARPAWRSAHQMSAFALYSWARTTSGACHDARTALSQGGRGWADAPSNRACRSPWRAWAPCWSVAPTLQSRLFIIRVSALRRAPRSPRTEFALSVVVDQDIARLDIAVHDALCSAARTRATARA